MTESRSLHHQLRQSRSESRLPRAAQAHRRSSISVPRDPFKTARIFYPLLPRHHCTTALFSQLLRTSKISSKSYECVVDGFTRLKLRRFHTYNFSSSKVYCLALEDIEVDICCRRQGRARHALSCLQQAASDNMHALVVEHVVSEHMQRLIVDSFGGSLFGGAGENARGAGWVDYHLLARTLGFVHTQGLYSV